MWDIPRLSAFGSASGVSGSAFGVSGSAIGVPGSVVGASGSVVDLRIRRPGVSGSVVGYVVGIALGSLADWVESGFMVHSPHSHRS